MPERHCKTCGLVVEQTKQPGDDEPRWYHVIQYVNPNRPSQYFRKCRVDFYAEPDEGEAFAEAMAMTGPLMPYTPMEIQSGFSVKVYVTVEDYNARGRDGHHIYVKTYPMAFLPDLDDDIEIGDGMTMTVRSRYWTSTGEVVLNLKKVYIDPPENIHMNRMPPTAITFWWTDRNADLHKTLADDGWKPYAPTTEGT